MPRLLPDTVLPGRSEGGLLEEDVTTLDCLVDLDLSDNHIDGESARTPYEYRV